MPRISTNPKSIEHREKKEAKKVATANAKVQAKEDAYWAQASSGDTDKRRKDARADDAEAKRQAEIEKKAELKRLYDEEMSGFSSKPTAKQANKNAASGKKMTRAQIARRQALEALAMEEELKRKKQERSKYIAPEDQAPLEENINRAEQERIQDEGILEARNIEQAMDVLDIAAGKSTGIDRHPEKRVKTAYKEFEDERFGALKAENPSLKRSQLQQMIKKEWKKSPRNPLNQQ